MRASLRRESRVGRYPALIFGWWGVNCFFAVPDLCHVNLFSVEILSISCQQKPHDRREDELEKSPQTSYVVSAYSQALRASNYGYLGFLHDFIR